MQSKIQVHATLGAAFLLAAACTEQEAPTASAPAVATARQALGPCDPVNIDQSMVVHDQATIGAADFSFLRTIQAIRTTSGGTATTDAALAQTITTGLLNTSFNNPVSGLAMAASPRPAEAGLNGAALLTEMQPIALFNRFDLAPANGSNCGEYRIVYGRYPNAVLSRFLLIFESRLPNPNPGLGLAGCAPVANFWHNLSDPGLTPAQRATMLADFYYNGLPGFSAVVTHGNYGVPLGQVRANMFLQQPWQLREWRTSFDLGGAPVFTPDTDKDNPLAEFYDETSFANPLFVSEQAAFQTAFNTTNIFNLLGFELNGAGVTACPEVNTVSAHFDDRFNEFQSNSQGSSDDPDAQASPNFRAGIDTVLASNTAFAGLTNTHVLNRAGTVTCGGCHQFSVNKPISPTANWPGVAAGGFVHVRELGAAPPAITPLSPALTNCFLPARAEILETFVCAQGGGGSDAGVSDSGSTPDSGTTPDAGTADSGTPVSCGGPYGNTCAANEYCEFGPYNVCGASGPGVCTPRPVNCSYVVNEVCGCDGQTYTNACFANAAGTDVSSQGACGGGSTCNLRPPSGCCFEDSQCTAIKGGRCVGEVCSDRRAGVCKGAVKDGQCWEDSDCGRGEVCDGEQICPCGALCLVPDSPGTCRAVTIRTASVQSASAQTASFAGAATNTTSTTDVEAARQSLLSASTTEDAERALEDLESAVREERSREAALPGAFWPVRRTH